LLGAEHVNRTCNAKHRVGKKESETNIAVRFPQHLEAEEAEGSREARELVTAVGRAWCH
jgi:hypothetical protein